MTEKTSATNKHLEKKIMQIKLDKEYEVKTTLGTIREIEKSFNKPFIEVINSAVSMKVDEQIKLLFAGVKKANPSLDIKEFNDLCDDYISMGALMEYLEQYIFALQYPGMTEQEVQEKIEKKLLKHRKIEKAVGKIS
ncbi:MAG: hypothetical protein FWE22_00745 [Firmicutes bacterium]|nr:hypothetical protein [Bacillota bacterium]